jgi:protein-S-isoprenylcysteine O-methyltransferase Ste14
MWHWLLAAPWMVLLGWWVVRAFGTARTETHESPRSRVAHLSLFAAGTLFLVATPEPLRQRLWHPSLPLLVLALVLEVAGVAFAIWAREHLGNLWSATVTLKEEHRLVQSGPYRYVRHPIYTGIMTGMLAVALSRGDLAGVVTFAFFALGIARKIAGEEALLGERFGSAYADYCKKVRAIIPFIL